MIFNALKKLLRKPEAAQQEPLIQQEPVVQQLNRKVFFPVFLFVALRAEPVGERKARYYEIGNDVACVADPDIPEFDELNPLQSFFKSHYDPDKNVLVEAGTGVGKTTCIWIAQMIVRFVSEQPTQ